MAASLWLVDLITPPVQDPVSRQPKPLLFGYSVGRNSGSCFALDAALIVLVVLPGQIKA